MTSNKTRIALLGAALACAVSGAIVTVEGGSPAGGDLASATWR